MQAAIRVLIADDRSRSRNGLKALLSTFSGLDIVGEAADGLEAMQLVQQMHPDVVVMDARMPKMDGVTAARMIKEKWTKVRVVLLTMYGSYRSEAISAGADAFLIKGCPPGQLLEAIQDLKQQEVTE